MPTRLVRLARRPKESPQRLVYVLQQALQHQGQGRGRAEYRRMTRLGEALRQYRDEFCCWSSFSKTLTSLCTFVLVASHVLLSITNDLQSSECQIRKAVRWVCPVPKTPQTLNEDSPKALPDRGDNTQASYHCDQSCGKTSSADVGGCGYNRSCAC